MTLTKDQINKIYDMIVEDSHHGCLNRQNFINTEEYLKSETLTVIEEIFDSYISPLLNTISEQQNKILEQEKKLKENEEWMNWASNKINELENKV